MPEYRPIPDERREEYRRFVDYAFRPESGPRTDDDDDPGLGDLRGLFEDDELLCVCKHHWFTARIRGDWHDLAGLSAVASPPESRRRGLVQRMLRDSLREYREKEVYFSALWPFDYGFYRRYGWGTVTRYTEYETAPDALALDTEPVGEFRRLTADDWERLVPVHQAHGEPYALTVDRTEEWWRRRVFEGWKKDPYVYAWTKDGEARGYVAYSIEEGDGKQLHVRDLAFADHEAYRHLLRFVQYHDSQVEGVRFYEPENADLLDIVADPREVECEIKPGPMFRLVDVPRALESVRYPDDSEGRVVVRVTDQLAEWNEGTFALDVGEATRCDRVDDDPDVTTDVNTLSQVVAGYHSVDEAERFGGFSVENPPARDRLAAMFPAEDVFLREGF